VSYLLVVVLFLPVYSRQIGIDPRDLVPIATAVYVCSVTMFGKADLGVAVPALSLATVNSKYLVESLDGPAQAGLYLMDLPLVLFVALALYWVAVGRGWAESRSLLSACRSAGRFSVLSFRTARRLPPDSCS